jgi:protein SCO1/2
MTNQGQVRNRFGILAGIIVVLAALGAGMLVASLLLRPNVDFSELSATVLREPRALAPFGLLDHHGEAFTADDLRGQWSFLFFGYTHCPDVCPTTLSVLNSVAGKLADTDGAARFVFVTVDPERDTPAVLARYVTYFNGEFLGVTGERAAIDALTRQLGILHMRVEEQGDAASYLVDHTASVLLFNPAGEFQALFSPPLDADTIAGEFRIIADAL